MNLAGLALAAFLFAARELPPSGEQIAQGRLLLAQVEIARLKYDLADREARLAQYELTAAQQGLIAADKKLRPLARIGLFDFLNLGGKK